MPPGSANVEVRFQPNRREPESRLPLCRTELWLSELHQSESFPFSCWLLAGRGARANLPTWFRGYSLTAPTHPKCSARRRVRGDHFPILRLPYSLQNKHRNSKRSSMKCARLQHLTRVTSSPA